MKLYPIELPDGTTAAFEIENRRIGRRKLCELVGTIPGATNIRPPKWLSWFREDVFCEFEIDGVRFEAEELYGDNDRYWIGPSTTGRNGEPLRYYSEIVKVIDAFEAA